MNGVLLFLAELEVHVGPHPSWFSQNLGSLVLAGAALLAAAVTIVDRRQALANDRYLKRMEHTRDRIDNALTLMTTAQGGIGNFLASIRLFEQHRDKAREETNQAATAAARGRLKSTEKKIQEILAKERAATLPLVQSLAASEVHLEVRLGFTHEIYLKHELARKAVFALFQSLLSGVDDNRPWKTRDDDDGLNEARHEANRAFRAECRDWFVTESPSEPWSARTRRLFSRGG